MRYYALIIKLAKVIENDSMCCWQRCDMGDVASYVPMEVRTIVFRKIYRVSPTKNLKSIYPLTLKY